MVAALVEGLSFWSVLPLLRTILPVTEVSAPTTALPSRLFSGLQGLPTPWILLLVLALFASSAALSLARSWFSERFQWRLRKAWVLRIKGNFLELPYLEFRSRRLGSLMNTLVTETRLGALCIWELAEGSARLVLLSVLSVILWLTEWRAAVVVLAFGGLFTLVARPLMFRRAAELGRRQLALNQHWKAVATENLLGFREIKLLGREREATESLREDLTALARTASLRRLLRSAPGAVSTLAFVALVLALFASLRAFSATDSTAWLPVLGFAAVLSRRLMVLGAGAVAHFSAFRGLLPSLELVHGAAGDAEEEGRREGGSGRIPGAASQPKAARVSFDGVDFAYPGKAAVLRRASFRLEAGRISLLLGPSGAGKSTVADLLLGLLQPSAGEIRIGREPLPRLDLKAWRRAVGYVSQESFFFNGSVRENLLAARPEATNEALRAACRVAGAQGFLEDLEEGLETLLGERGFELSGGERQRLAIARAVLRKPPLLVLDEVTSAVDPETALEIWARLSRLGPETTVLVLSHEVPAGLEADHVLGLEGGVIREMTQSPSLEVSQTA